MADDEVGDALKRRVETEIKAIREKAETEMKERLKEVEKGFDRTCNAPECQQPASPPAVTR